VCFLFTHEAVGAASARHSPRPHFQGRATPSLEGRPAPPFREARSSCLGRDPCREIAQPCWLFDNQIRKSVRLVWKAAQSGAPGRRRRKFVTIWEYVCSQSCKISNTKARTRLRSAQFGFESGPRTQQGIYQIFVPTRLPQHVGAPSSGEWIGVPITHGKTIPLSRQSA
jgi:hypothetical protein